MRHLKQHGIELKIQHIISVQGPKQTGDNEYTMLYTVLDDNGREHTIREMSNYTVHKDFMAVDSGEWRPLVGEVHV